MILIGFVPNSIIFYSMLERLSKRRNLVNGGWDINEVMAKKLVGLCFEVEKVEEMEELLAERCKIAKDKEIQGH